MKELTAMQKVRLALTGDPNGEPHFKHEGPNVVRWITGTALPDIHVTIEHTESGIIRVQCAFCSYTQCGKELYSIVDAMQREHGHAH